MPPKHPHRRTEEGRQAGPARLGEEPRQARPGVVPGARRRGAVFGRWAGRGAARAAGFGGMLWRRALAAAGSETGRRLARAAALTVALAVLVVTLYDRGEVPTAAAQPALRATPTDVPGAAARGGDARRKRPDDHGGLRGRSRPAPGDVKARPAEVAAAWYAARHGLPRARVKPLQQDRLSASEVRVLVLADPGNGRLRTALVRVRRGANGWSVP
jgi:hypothetical protein